MKPILVFGEILWDVFGSEEKIGGAPFNFASHLSSLGAPVYMVSALGPDRLGDLAAKELEKNGVCGKYVARNEFITGRCDVTTGDDGHPRYDLKKNVAYDHIPMPELTEEFSAFYFGSLAMRSFDSYKTLTKLLEGDYGTVFCDINVRMPNFFPALALPLIGKADILKISREEAEHIIPGVKNPESICDKLLDKYPKLKTVLVTLDKDGAMVYDRKCGVSISGKPESKAISTVGAGDSFSAAYVYNCLCGKNIPDCLDRAVTLSDFVVTKLGAVPEIPEDLRIKLTK